MVTRIISGICIGLIVIAGLALGGWVSFALVTAISLIGIYELYKVSGIERKLIAVCGYVATVAYYLLIALDKEQYSMLLIVITLMSIMSIYVLTFPKFKADNAIMAMFGVIYVAIMLSYMYKIRIMENGIYLVWLVLIASWGNDTCAYFTGVFIGKHKMAPVLSPKKSVEGAIGGVVGAAVLGGIYGYVVSGIMADTITYPIAVFAVASGLGALLAIIGDLAASAIKRNYNIKDYGNLIPGHGGILDRFDSCIFTAPVVFWAIYIIEALI